MRTLFIIPLVLMSLVSFPSWGLTMDDLVKRDGLWYEKFTATPFTGEIEGKEQGEFKEGKRDGSWISYHENGQFNAKVNFKNGKRDGSWIRYHENGKMNSKGNFKNGKRDGSWISYYANGVLGFEGKYKNGKYEGFWIRHYNNGRLSEKSNWKNGKVEGYTEHYNVDGTVNYILTGTYKNGVKVSD